MKRLLIFAWAVLSLQCVLARSLGFGVDAFNRVVPGSAARETVFSPASFEIDSVVLAEAVDPIRRSIFSEALHVMDELGGEYKTLARQPLESPGTNGVDLVWAHAVVAGFNQPVDTAYCVNLQELYGVEVCPAWRVNGIEAWIRTSFSGTFDGWRLPELPDGPHYALFDLVSVAVEASPSNGWKRLCPTHTVYRQPLKGGTDFYAIAPKRGRALSSIRARVTSLTLPGILAMSSAVIDPPEPVRLALPKLDCTTTNELAGAFSYFHFPTAPLKPFPIGTRPAFLRQTVRFRLKPAATEEDSPAEPLEGPFLFFIHDPVLKTLPVMGLVP